MKRGITTIAITALVLVAAPGAASASGPAHAAVRCSIGDSGVTYNRNGTGAVFKNLRAEQGMNCASARYVLNKWLRRAFRRSSRNRLPTRFYDGYVTWHCGRTSQKGWRCTEFESNTAFRFVAYLL